MKGQLPGRLPPSEAKQSPSQYSHATRWGLLPPAFAGVAMTGVSLVAALRAAVLVIGLLSTGASALAQSTHTMPGMPMGAAPSPDEAASTKAYRDAMAKMNQGMAITYSGDADKDFVAGMIAHHQGAIDMAKVELQYGKDPQLHKLARNIIAAQRKEIAFMKSWQAKNAQ
jgi:uncharacterized protein (DUF305 family)